MKRLTADPETLRLVVGGVLVYVLIAAGGALASPLLPLASVWLFSATVDRPRLRAAPLYVGAAIVLLATELLRESVGWRDVAALTAAFAAAWLPARLVRARAARTARRIAHLDHILAEAELPEARTPAAVVVQQLRDIEQALHDLGRRVGARRIVLWRVDPGAELARPVTSSGGPMPRASAPLESTPMGWAWKEGMHVQLEPAPPWAAHDARVVAARLRRDGTEGTIVTYEFDTDAARAAPDVLDAAATMLRATLLTHELQMAAVGDRRRLDLLMRTLRRIPVEPQMDAVARELLHAALELVDASGGAIALWDPAAGGVVLSCLGGDGGPDPGTIFAPLESEMGLAAHAENRIVRQDRPRNAKPVAASGERWIHPPRALASVPLVTPSGVTAVLSLWNSGEDSIGDEALELLDAAAPYFALVLNHAREYGKARESADRDPLTGLRNRRAFDRELDAESARFERYDRPLAVALVDLDHFKQINDSHGHEAGDAVLQAVARTLELTLRDIDIPARFGGEEFVVLFPETDLAHARDAAERLRTAIEKLSFSWRGTPIPIHASIGVSACPECAAAPDALVRSADEALYAAKSAGRNRVVTARPPRVRPR